MWTASMHTGVRKNPKRIQSNSIIKKVPVTWGGLHHPIKFLVIDIIKNLVQLSPVIQTIL